MTPRSRLSESAVLFDTCTRTSRVRNRLLAVAVAVSGATMIVAALPAGRAMPQAITETSSDVHVRGDERAPGRAETRHDRAEEQRVKKLAAIVAKRYRVANEATRQVVEIAYHEAKLNRLDPLLVLAVIAVESRFNPGAESEGGAMGLMQVVPRYHVHNAEDASRAAMLDPRRNIGLGARVLRQYVTAGGTEKAGLQRYNGTRDDATNAYANKVLAERQRLIDSLQGAADRA